jgi:hypothetical protein
MQNHNRYLAQAGQQTNRFGVVTQQAGYQIGDFLVQVQSGTNWMVAFGQQATQLVGVLPLMGAGFMGLSTGALVALSAGLGIAIPLVTAIGAAFMRTSSEADSSSQSIDTYAQALEGLQSSLKGTQVEIDKLSFGTEDPAMAAALKALGEAELNLAQARANQRRIGNAIVPTSEEAATLREAVNSFTEIAGLVRELEARNVALAEAQNMLNGGLSVAAGIQKGLVYDKQVELQEAKQLQKEHAAQLSYMGKTRQESDNFVQSLISAYTLLANSRGVAAGLADEMARAASARQAALVGGGRSMTRGGPELDPYGFRAQLERDKARTPVRSGGGGRQADLRKEIELTKELTQAEKDRQTILKSIEGSLESGFMSMVDGTKSVKDAFRSMAAEIIKELYRVLVVQRLVGAISGGIGMFSGPSTGSLGLPFGLATGGSVMPGKSYLVGENGPELVIPRHSGTVVNANQTAGAAGGNGTTVVNNNISVTGSDAAMVRAEVAKMIPQITNATKAAVIDARLRGGQMKAAFA